MISYEGINPETYFSFLKKDEAEDIAECLKQVKRYEIVMRAKKIGISFGVDDLSYSDLMIFSDIAIEFEKLSGRETSGRGKNHANSRSSPRR